MLRLISRRPLVYKLYTLRGVRRITVHGRYIPDHIEVPHYAQSGVVKAKSDGVQLLTSEDEVSHIQDACRIAKNVLDYIETRIRPGVSTGDIDDMAYQRIIEANAYPVPLNFHGFPKSVCTSVNEVVVHGIPSHKTVLRDGDIVNVDVTVYYRGYYGDVSETFPVGDIDKENQRLVAAAREAVKEAIRICKPGTKLNRIGSTIEDVVGASGFRVCSHYCGHGLGRELHLAPNILHYRNESVTDEMEVGMCFTIEPALMSGSGGIKQWDDGWTIVSVDGKRSAQHERAILITKDGCLLLT